jgi:prepilin-type N-terminal cleavage/methylation domain-containing protein
MRKYGFTLAEVLITLAIIGVVAALTIPSVVRNYQKTQTVTRLKKAYTIMNQAVAMSELENAPKEQWNYSLDASTFYENYLKKILKGVAGLRLSTPTLTYTALDGKTRCTWAVCGINVRKIGLADGMFLFIGNSYSQLVGWRPMAIDINGEKGPNRAGKDMFTMDIFAESKDKVTLSGYVAGHYSSYSSRSRESMLGTGGDACNPLATGGGGGQCAALIMMDGWQIKDDYPWN